MNDYIEKAKEYAQKYCNHKMAVHDTFDLEAEQNNLTKLLTDFGNEIVNKLNCIPAKYDQEHHWYAYKKLSDTKWTIDYAVSESYPKCEVIEWFRCKEAVMLYLVSNGMKYEETSVVC